MSNDIQNDEFIIELRALINGCGDNQRDRAIVGISACIDRGITKSADIVRTLEAVGLNAQYVRIIIAKSVGPSPARHRWWRDDDGNYHLHS